MVNFINSKVRIPPETKERISSVIKTEKFNKNHLLLKEGMVPHRLFFISKGVARTFYYHDGKDVTSWLYREESLVTSWGNFYARTPTFENIELLEDSIIQSISYDDLQLLYSEEAKMQIFGRIISEEQVTFIEGFYKGFFFMNAREKYDLLLSSFPDVSHRVNLGHIASFLGISQETLSRIRNKK